MTDAVHRGCHGVQDTQTPHFSFDASEPPTTAKSRHESLFYAVKAALMLIGVMSGVTAFAAGLPVLTAMAEPISGVVQSSDERVRDAYVPAMLSNGRLCVFCDYTLSVPGEEQRYVKKNLRPGIWWEGRRYGDNSGKAGSYAYQFFPQGRVSTRLVVDGVVQKEPLSWRQRLNLRTATTDVRASYDGGVRLEGEMFVPQARNLIAVRQTVAATDAARDVEIGVFFVRPVAERLVGSWKTDSSSATWSMKAYARFVTHETIAVRTDDGSPCSVRLVGGNAELVQKVHLEPGEARTFAWYVEYSDDLADSLPPVTRAPMEIGPAPGYDKLRSAHVADWESYFAESEIEVPDARIRSMSDMARYHLRCNATEWSIPVGIIQSHWQGRIFAFDEMYGVQGLVSAGHFATARTAADFRAATLRNACVRNNKDARNPFYSHGARWVWEAAEGNDVEAGPIGYFNDHVFHSAAVAQTVWAYCRYTGDIGYLKEKGYDVMRECALFFRRLCVQDMPDGTSFVSKCTDLERLGPGRDHAFMTTCGVIATLRAAARAADLVGKDSDLAADFRACADRLVASLPVKDGRYVPYPGCTEESMGTLAGFYPFQIFGRDSSEQVAAARHFLANGEAFGNMYATGKRICPWYAATMSVAALRAGDAGPSPVRWLQEAFRSAGCWGEYWEINEPGVAEYRPWFMTAAGNCLYAINQLFVTERDGALHLASGVPPDWKDYSFRLPAPGGLSVEMRVADGKLAHLRVTPSSPSAEMPRIVLPDGMTPPADFAGAQAGGWVSMEDIRRIEPGSALDFSGVSRSPARTYGANLCFTATAPEKEDADETVARLVRSGYSSVRLHHFEWNFFGQEYASPGDARDKFDYLVAAAVSNGLSLATDLYASRRAKWEDFGIEDRKGVMSFNDYKGLVQVNGRAMDDWKRHAAEFLLHRNPYTGRTYAEEPALRWLTYLNEGNLTCSFENVRKYADTPIDTAGRHNSVVWAELTGAAEREMRRFVRGLGCRAPLTDLNNGPYYTCYHPLLAANCDFVDVHYYFDHPERVDGGKGMPPASFKNRSPVDQVRSLFSSVPPARLAGKPFVVTEWNAAGPAPRRGGTQLGFAALAALQGWDGAWRFAWSHRPAQLKDGSFAPAFFDNVTDPVNRALEAAVVCLYARGDMLTLENEVCLVDTPEVYKSPRFGGVKGGDVGWTPENALSARISSVPAGGAVPQGAKTVLRADNGGKPAFPAGLAPSDAVVFGDRFYTVKSDRTCGGFGEEGASFSCGPLGVYIKGAEATVWASSLDGRPLQDSEHILFGHVTDAQAAGTRWRDGGRSVVEKFGEPGRLEARAGTAEIRLAHVAAENANLYALDMGGRRRCEVPLSSGDGRIDFRATVRQPFGGAFFYEYDARPCGVARKGKQQ